MKFAFNTMCYLIGALGFSQSNLTVTADQTIPTPSVIDNLIVQNGATLTIDGNVTVEGNFDINDGSVIVTNSSTLTTQDNIRLNNSTSSLTVESGSSIDGSGGGNFQVNDPSASVTVDGSIDVGSNNVSSQGTITGSGSIESSGTVTNTGTFFGATDSPPSSCTGGSCSDPALPIELLSWAVVREDDKLIAKWSTASEINNDFFTIEESTDGFEFKPIKKVRGAGNSNVTLNYREVIIPTNQALDILYYRLKQTDFDGAYDYSPTVWVTSDRLNSEELLVYPNPVADEDFFVILPSVYVKKLSIVDNTANMILELSDIENESRLLSISTTGLAAGNYNLIIETEVGRISSRLIKK